MTATEPETQSDAPASEEDWLARFHRRGQPQLTARAIGFGIAIGALMCMSNLYVFFNSIAMFLGAAIAELIRRRFPRASERFVVPVASGLIAGESLMGGVIALLVVAGVLAK
jgi:hypothetical protein